MSKENRENLDAEKSVLGGALLENDALDSALEFLVPEDFYRDSHREIFKALIALSDRNEPADLVTLTAELKKNNQLENVGGSSYLAGLIDHVSSADDMAHYARTVKENSVERHTRNVAAETGTLSTRELMQDTFIAIEQLYERKELTTGVPTGYVDIDTMLAGLQKGDLIVVGGRSSMGKTSLCLNFVEHSTLHAKCPMGALLFSLETSNQTMVQRLLCSVSRIDASRLRTGHLGDSDWPKLTNGAGLLSESAIYISNPADNDLDEICDKAREMKEKEKDIGLIVVDPIEHVRAKGFTPGSNRSEELSHISRTLKALALELDIPVVVTTCLDMRLLDRTHKRPQIEDLHNKGSLEQDADVIMFVYRESAYCDACKRKDGSCDKNHKNDAEVIIAKQKNGPTGTVHLTFKGEFARFENSYHLWLDNFLYPCQR